MPVPYLSGTNVGGGSAHTWNCASSFEKSRVIEEKKCARCASFKPMSEFGRNRQWVGSYCRDCRNALTRAWKKSNPEKVNADCRAWRKANPEKHRAMTRAWREKNMEKFSALVRAWSALNPDRRRMSVSKYAKNNMPMVLARNKLYQQRKRRAVPSWANTFFMEEAYALAQLRTRVLGYEWEVDHIVPLRSPIVCGLHTHDNLQVIPARLNYLKSNRYWPDMPEQETPQSRRGVSDDFEQLRLQPNR